MKQLDFTFSQIKAVAAGRSLDLIESENGLKDFEELAYNPALTNWGSMSPRNPQDAVTLLKTKKFIETLNASIKARAANVDRNWDKNIDTRIAVMTRKLADAARANPAKDLEKIDQIVPSSTVAK